VSLPARPYFQHASPLSPPDKEKPLLYENSRVRFARQAIFHRSREAWKNAVAEPPKLARQDVKPHPDRSNLVPSAKSQFPNSKIHIMKHFRHPPIVAAAPLHFSSGPRDLLISQPATFSYGVRKRSSLCTISTNNFARPKKPYHNCGELSDARHSS